MSVSRHTGYNLIGGAVPLALALVTVPIYLRLVGPDRYGVLAIAWLVLGYFGLFDLGLGQATSFRVAALRDATPLARARTFWAALFVNTGMGLVGGAALWFAARFFFGHVFKVQEALRPEILRSMPFLAASVPVATVTGVLSGALQGRERFLETNIISTFSTCLFLLLPLAVAWRFGPDLAFLLCAAVTARLLAALAFAYRCYLQFGRGYRPRLERQEVLLLLKYGGWVTATSAFGPILVVADRFLIGAILGAVPVAIYSVPFELARQITLLPMSLTSALFPRLAAAPPTDQKAMGEQATRVLAALLSLPVLGAIFLVQPFLDLWVGRHIGIRSAPIGRILLIGFWANGFAMIPYTRLQAGGRPDLVTKVLVVQIVTYVACFYLATMHFGLAGAAGALAIRLAADYAILTWISGRDFRSLPLLAGNLGMLLLGAYCATRWQIVDWRWWLSASVLGTATSIVGWLALPIAFRKQATQRIADFVTHQT